MHLVLNSPLQLGVAELYREHFQDLIIEPALKAFAGEWGNFYAETGLPEFSSEAPLILHPHNNPFVRGMDVFTFKNHLTWMQIYKHILRLPPETEPQAPRKSPEAMQDAVDLCKSAGMEPGRSVILFPYAQTLPVNSAFAFQALSAELKSQGWSVFTSVAGGELPIPGTTSILIPFPLLIDVVEIAGWAISVRSGICDIVSGAQCRKTFIFPDRNEIRDWGVDNLGLSFDATQVIFDFTRSNPGDLAAVVLPNPPARHRPPIDGLSGGFKRSTEGGFSFVDLQRGVIDARGMVKQMRTHWKKRWFAASSESPLHLHDIPARDNPRWSRFIYENLQQIVADLGLPIHLYTYQNDGYDDFIEEVDAENFAHGRYYAARRRHTLVMARNDRLEAFLLPSTRPYLLRLERGLARSVDLASAYIALTSGSDPGGLRPWAADGVQLVQGWYGLEPFGAWSRGRRSVLKIALDHRLPGGFRIVLHFRPFVSPALPQMDVQVHVNGLLTLTSVITYEPLTERLEIDVPSSLTLRSDTFWIEVNLSHVGSPSELFGEEDSRCLGLGLSKITISPQAPL